MAHIIPNATIDLIRGSVGDTVFYPLNGRQVMRERVTPLQPVTALRTLINSSFSTAVSAWPATTDSERSLWDSLAVDLKRVDKDGRHYNPTGRGVFIGLNVMRLLANQPTTTIAPPIIDLPAPGGFTASIDGAGVVNYSIDHNIPSGFLLLEVSPAVSSAQKAYPRDIRQWQLPPNVFRNFRTISGSPTTGQINQANTAHSFVTGNIIGVKVSTLTVDYLTVASKTFRVTLT